MKSRDKALQRAIRLANDLERRGKEPEEAMRIAWHQEVRKWREGQRAKGDQKAERKRRSRDRKRNSRK